MGFISHILSRAVPAPTPPPLSPPAAAAADDPLTPKAFSVLSPLFHNIIEELDVVAPHLWPLVSRCGDYKVVDQPGLMVDENFLQGLVALPPAVHVGPVPPVSLRYPQKATPARDNRPSYEPFCTATALGFDSLELMVRFVTLTCWRCRYPGSRVEHDGDWRPFQAYFPRVTRFVLSLDVFQSAGVDGWGTLDAWEHLARVVRDRAVVELVLRNGLAVETSDRQSNDTASARIAWMIRLVSVPHTLRVVFCDSGPLHPSLKKPEGNPNIWHLPVSGAESLPLRVILNVLSLGRGRYKATPEEGTYEWVMEDAEKVKERVKWEIDKMPQNGERKETVQVFKKRCKFVEIRRR
ncbi:hypothetical protein IAT38_004605 [Cryptococcus sp. DSM 104549]